MKFEVTILGSSSATPIFQRNPTSQILNINERLYMIDCGEGTQQQMLKFGIRYNKLDHIFISHLHGDHYFGLIGLLSSMHLNGRTKPLNLYAPPELKEILDLQFKYSATILKYEIIYFATQSQQSEVILENKDFVLETIILNHRIPCTGFVFKGKTSLRKINKQLTEPLNIPKEYYPLIKKGIDYIDSKGNVHNAFDLTTDPDEPKSYAYCSDTLCSKDYLPQITNVNMLYHEATFEHEMVSRAKETFHSTALEAAEIAFEANVDKLIIGHFSARYRDLTPLLLEARSVFSNTFLAVEGETFTV